MLERACPDCGYDARVVDRGDLGALIRESSSPWPDVLAGPDSAVPPASDVWSSLEYACHGRRGGRGGRAESVAYRYDAVAGAEWQRRGRRSNGSIFSVGSIFTVESLGRYHLHDVMHHRWDVGS